MNIYKTSNISINSVIRVASECAEGERIYYNGYCSNYELICCLSGEDRVTFQNKTFYDIPNGVRFLPRRIKDNTYCVENIKSGECIDIMFSTDCPMPDTIFVNDYSGNKIIRQLFIKTHSIWHKKQTGYYNKCLSLFYEILYEMQITDAKYSPKSHNEKISNGVSYILNHYGDKDFDYTQLAIACNISYTYFKKLFSEIYNTTPSEYLKNLRIQNACELLLTNRFSVSQVADMCGYDNIYYFSKVFKEAIGVPPSEYKRQL